MDRRFITIVSLAWALSLLSCGGPEATPAIGEAFVGPSALKIRSDIPLQSAVVATVKHGDRLEILQQRRRFFRVRTPSGAQGWTDERQLLAAEDMRKLKDLAVRAVQMPVQGQATTFGELNVHTLPARQSPSFLQVKENEKVDVLMHTLTPRAEVSRKPLIPPPPKKTKAVKPEEKKAAKESKYPPLPPPKPPGPPPNWLDLSKTDLSADEEPDDVEVKDEKAVPEARPTPMDDWSLIRTKNGESGWVLTRRLVMAIPDDVAQYAEGRRIVSYFPLGEIQDGDEKKHHWLWTTIGEGTSSYDFDSFRVFIWSLRRHRYETAYIDRNLRGYAPVRLQNVELAAPKGKSSDGAKYPGFSICVEKKDGQRYRRDYAFITNVVRFAGEHSCESAALPDNLVSQSPLKVAPAEPQPSESFSGRVRKRLRTMTRSWFGR